MRKRTLIPLSVMMLCSICFSTACGKTNTTTTNVIATINGKQITAESVARDSKDVTAEDIYNAALYDQKTAEYVYEALEKALIQSAIPATNSMKTKVENEVNKWRLQIEENAKLNSTDYQEDLTKALEAENVSTVDELIEKKIYALQTEYAKEKFMKAMGESYSKQYIDNNYLYHVSDIGISISSSSTNTDLYNITISTDEAKNIYGAFRELVTGENYYTVAERYSGLDSAKNGGELGIVTLNDSGITNELRYALIGYSSIIEGKYDKFNLPNETGLEYKALQDFYTKGIQSIPYSYIKDLDAVYSTKDGKDTKNYETNTSFYYSSGGDSVSSSSKVYYRNIVFNNLLNTKTPKFITVTQEDVDAGAHAVKMDVLLPNVETAGYSNSVSEEYVLVNDLGNPYVVFKDSKGLHILSVNKTPFDEDVYDYYSSNLDNDDYVAYAEFGKNMDERLTQVKSFAEKYITRNYGTDTGEDKLLSFAIFKYYLGQANNGGFEIVNENVEKMLNQYMNSINKLADDKATASYLEYYDDYSNLVWFRNQSYIVKEVPLLSCLVKSSDDKYSCTYDYGNGFSVYKPSSGSEG